MRRQMCRHLKHWLAVGTLGLVAGCACPMPTGSGPQALSDQGATTVAIDAVQRQSPAAQNLILVDLIKSNGTYQVLLRDRTSDLAERNYQVLIRGDGRALVLPPERAF